MVSNRCIYAGVSKVDSAKDREYRQEVSMDRVKSGIDLCSVVNVQRDDGERMRGTAGRNKNTKQTYILHCKPETSHARSTRRIASKPSERLRPRPCRGRDKPQPRIRPARDPVQESRGDVPLSLQPSHERRERPRPPRPLQRRGISVPQLRECVHLRLRNLMKDVLQLRREVFRDRGRIYWGATVSFPSERRDPR